jgi:uncharacterized protein with HEPN domain
MNHAIDFVKGMKYDRFVWDTRAMFAVVRALEKVGEATKKIPDEVKQRYPSIPWKDMAGMRDKLIHEYCTVKLEVVWDTVNRENPDLIVKFKEILSDTKE